MGKKNSDKYYEEVKLEAEKYDFELLSNEYINMKTPMLFKCKKCKHEFNRTFDNFKRNTECPQCKIQNSINIKKEEYKNYIETDCKDWMQLAVISIEFLDNKYYADIIDENNYKYYCEFSIIRNSRRRGLQLNRFFRENKYTYENINNYLKIENKDIVLLTKKVNSAIEELKWFCPQHGIFLMSWNCIKNGQGCQKCANIRQGNAKRNSYEYVKNIFESKDLILISKEYITNNLPLEYICLHHQEDGIQTITFAKLLDGGCKICSKERQIKNMTKTHEQFISDIMSVHGNKYTVVGKYVGANKHILIHCNSCGEDFSMKASHLLSGHGCGNCTKSIGEAQVQEYLKNKRIPFLPQYTFDNCRGLSRKLPFDFAIFKDMEHTILLYLIEYQGIQHYQPVEMFGGEKQFLLQQEYDNIKRNYCKKNSIKLIEIPYWEFKNINQILDNKSREVLKDISLF